MLHWSNLIDAALREGSKLTPMEGGLGYLVLLMTYDDWEGQSPQRNYQKGLGKPKWRGSL